MNTYHIRFNKTRGQQGRGTTDHVWRVFENEKEYLVKNIKINVPSYGAQTELDYSICCSGKMFIDRETSTIIINKE